MIIGRLQNNVYNTEIRRLTLEREALKDGKLKCLPNLTLGGSNLEIKRRISYTRSDTNIIISDSVRCNSRENDSTLLFLHGMEKTELFKMCVAMYSCHSVVQSFQI